MRTPKITGMTTALVVATALVVSTNGASAQEFKDPEPGERVLDAETSNYYDARALAGQKDWELEPTLRYVDESRRFAALAASLAEDFAESYASARYAAHPEDVSLVRFVHEPPQEAVARIKESGLPVRVVGDAKYTEAVLQDRARSVHKHLLESGYKQVVTGTLANDWILASVYGDGNPELPRELSENVKVSDSLRPVATDEHTRGGAPLFDGNNFECTSGFTVVNGNGTTGVATAGHCNGLDTYSQPSDGLTYDLIHQGQHMGLWGDFEWKTTPHFEPAEFYATSTQVRQVNSVSGWLPVNTPSCVYGRASNARACDQVYSSFVIATVNGTTYWFLMAMDNDNTIGGDSGGPWSWATIADGIHKGDITLGGGRRNMWSRAYLLPIALGVSVQTQ